MDLDLNIAGIKVRLIDADRNTIAISGKYLSSDDGKLPELIISASQDDISKVKAEDPSARLEYDTAKSFALLENLDMAMLEKDAFYLHASQSMGKPIFFRRKQEPAKVRTPRYGKNISALMP